MEELYFSYSNHPETTKPDCLVTRQPGHLLLPKGDPWLSVPASQQVWLFTGFLKLAYFIEDVKENQRYFTLLLR
jgi:hypothetical protein